MVADREETEGLLAGMVDNADGTHTPILAKDVEKAVAALRAGEKLLPDNVLHITPILHNLCSLEIDLEPLGDFAPNTMLPIEADGSVAITQGKFIVGFKDGEPPSEADLFLIGHSRLILGGETEPDYECNSVTLSIEDEDGWHDATKEELGGIDPGSVWQAIRPDGEAINFHTILSSLVLLRGIQAAYDNMAEEIQPANIKTIDVWNNHSLSAKVVIDGLFKIASGKSSYKTTPRNKNSRSNEIYEITANKEACTRLFGDGGTKWTVEAVLQTVYNLRTSKDAEKFVYQGRVWITVNTIVQEMRRTKTGTVEANKYQNDRKLVDNALLAASGAQVVGTTPDGKLTNTYYLLNAVRRDRVTYKGHEYRDVWGIVPDAETLNDYATSLGHVYRYPLLAWPSRDEDDRYRPFSLEDREIDGILRDLENTARRKLYKTDENNNPKPQRRKSYKVTLSWDLIFTGQSPVTPLNSHQKLGLVEEFQKVLEVHVAMDAKDKTRPGYPLYIVAYSTRIAGRGKGGGAWDNLVLECWRTYHQTSVDLVKGRKKSQVRKVEK